MARACTVQSSADPSLSARSTENLLFVDVIHEDSYRTAVRYPSGIQDDFQVSRMMIIWYKTGVLVLVLVCG